MKEISLTKGAVAIVDDDDYEELSKYRWFLSNGYAARHSSSKNGEKRMQIYMHRVVNKTNEGLDTDHINRNHLDNRKNNLRTCTRQENLRNSSTRLDNTSGYKGVSYHKKSNLYNARIRIGIKQQSLGYYETPIEAARAYNEAAIKYFGKFAKLNDL